MPNSRIRTQDKSSSFYGGYLRSAGSTPKQLKHIVAHRTNDSFSKTIVPNIFGTIEISQTGVILAQLTATMTEQHSAEHI